MTSQGQGHMSNSNSNFAGVTVRVKLLNVADFAVMLLPELSHWL